MSLRHLYVLTGSLAIATLVAWGLGSVHAGCEHSCPAQGPCPEAADCLRHPFNWRAAIVVGAVAAIVVALFGLLAVQQGDEG